MRIEAAEPVSITRDQQDGLVHHLSPPESKIALFRSLFRGRDDVYPRRFENRKTGKSGYPPACGNEWVPGVCEKPRIKCAACPNQRFLPVTDQVVRWHLSGHDDSGRDFVMGVYPLLRDETCFFLAADLDKAQWQEDAQAVLETCRRLDLAAALERSRSGNGGHIWLFFEQAIPATLARKLGAHLLTETMERRPGIGLDSYDRFFPNQDTLPQGGFGNLIALPLQKRPRELGNSVFLDDRHRPHADQWAFLSSIRKIDRATRRANRFRSGEAGTCCRRATCSRGRGRRHALGRASLATPKGTSARRAAARSARTHSRRSDLHRQRSTATRSVQSTCPAGGISESRVLQGTGDAPADLRQAAHHRLCRGPSRSTSVCHAVAWTRSKSCCRTCASTSVMRDERNAGKPLDVEFRASCTPSKRCAARDLLAHDTGVLSATTAFGKTVVAAWLIAERGVNTLVLVHRRQLLEQWVERLSAFLGLPPKAIGRIGGGRKKPTGSLDVAIIQSLVRKGVVSDLVGDYGHLIVDECHHLSAQSFEQVVRRAKAKFVTGLSATVTRKDGHHPIVFMQCGPVRHRVDAKAQAAARPFTHAVHVRPTGFRPSGAPAEDVRVQFQELYSELIADQARNQLICDDVLQAVHEGRSPLVLTERNEHLDFLAERLSTGIQHLIVLRGGMGKNEVGAVIARLAAIPENEPRALARDRTTHRRRVRRRAAGHVVPYAAGVLARHDRAIRGPIAPPARSQTRGARDRLRRSERAHAGAHVRSTLPRLRGRGLHDSAPRQRRAGMARGGSAARRSAVENRLRGQCPPAGARRGRHAAGESVRPRDTRRLLRRTRESVGRAARPRRSCTAAWRPCRTPRADSASMPSCRFRSMAAAGWKWICSVPMHAWPSSWTGHNIWTGRRPIAATGERTCSCRNTATSCCGSSPRTWAGASTPCSIRSCAHARTAGGEFHDTHMLDSELLAGAGCPPGGKS